MNQQRATCWSVTINNPVESDKEAIATAGQRRWTVTGQLEKGANGTPHYQLIVRTPQVRFSCVKKQFPRAHIEIAHHPTALAKYVVKEETRVSAIEGTEKYPSQAKTMTFFAEHMIKLRENCNLECLAPQQMLNEFDRMCSYKIEEGYYMELIAVNPQVRSAIMKFGLAIVARERARRRQDRQTTENVVAVSSITNAEASQPAS
nr:MAG: replication associated protein [Cressdnaviricota sp.]